MRVYVRFCDASSAQNEHHYWTLAQVAAECEKQTGRRPDERAVSRHLKADGFTTKTLHVEAAAKNKAANISARKDWLRTWGPLLTANNTIYFDETQSNASLAPTHGRSPKGEAAIKPVAVWKGKRVSVIGAFSPRDGLSYRVLEDDETVKADDFTAFVKQVARAVLRADADNDYYFIWDNASVHSPDLLDDLTKISPNFHGVFLPPYSPRLNPIEQMWNALKAPLKREQLTDSESVRRALAESYARLPRDSFPRYFEHIRDKIFPLVEAGDELH